MKTLSRMPMPSVPKIMHFIWIGTTIPDNYAKNIKKWIRDNPDYEVKLWIDSDIYNNKIDANQAAKKTGATVCDISDTPYKNIITQNVRWYYDECSGQHANFAAASDILRYEILYEYGGIYIDVDIESSGVPLGDIDAPLGFIRPAIHKKTGMTNDVLMSIPHAEILQDIISIVNQQYSQHFNKSDTEATRFFSSHRSTEPENLFSGAIKGEGRVTSTLEMSGPDVVAKAVQPIISDKFKNITNKDEADRATEEINKLLWKNSDSFIAHADHTWYSKYPNEIEKLDAVIQKKLQSLLGNFYIQKINDEIEILSSTGRSNAKLIADYSRLKKYFETYSGLLNTKEIFSSFKQHINQITITACLH